MTVAVTPGDDTRDAELRALERAMGAVAVDSAQDWGGEIADDDDDDDDRAAVVYGDDALFDSDDPPPQGEAAELGDLTGLLGDGGAESSSALIAYLEQMASGLEAQSGEEEREIRGKIAMLRSVLEARSGAVDQGLARLGGGQEGLQELTSGIEHGMGAVDALLQDDDARQLLAESAHVWMPAIGVIPQTSGELEREQPLSAD